MTSLPLRRPRLPSPDLVVSVSAVAMLGCGTALMVGSAARGDLPTALVGGAAAGVALVILLSAEWVDGLALVALSLPLPALTTDGGLRLSPAAPLTAAVVFAWIVRRGVAGRPLRVGRLPIRAAAALLGAYSLAAVLGPHPLVSLRELLNLSLLLAFLVVATDALSGDPARRAALLRLLVLVGGICGGLAVLETLTIVPGEFPRWDTPYNRAALGFGQPNALGLFLAVTLPLAVHLAAAAASPPERIGATLAAGAMALGLIGTFSRGSWLSLAGGAAVLLLTRDRRRALRIWLAMLAVAVVVDLVSGGMLRDTAVRTLGDWTIQQRALLTLAGVLMFLEHPLLGVGPGGFAEELDRFGARIPGLWDYLPTPHNAYVQMAAETGVVGLAAFLFFIGAVLRVLVGRAREPMPGDPERASLRRALLWSFATVCLAGLVEWPLGHGVGQAIFLVGALAFAPDGDRGKEPRRRERVVEDSPMRAAAPPLSGGASDTSGGEE